VLPKIQKRVGCMVGGSPVAMKSSVLAFIVNAAVVFSVSADDMILTRWSRSYSASLRGRKDTVASSMRLGILQYICRKQNICKKL
jgi:hypothetical protein